MKKLFLLLIVGILLTGCAPTMSDLQRRSIESKDIEGTVDTAYKATMAVLEDKGFVIKHTDFTSGVIEAETGMKMGCAWWAPLAIQCNLNITATLEQFGPNTVKERLTITKNSALYGREENTEVVDDPTQLQELYDQIQKEIFVRNNLSK